MYERQGEGGDIMRGLVQAAKGAAVGIPSAVAVDSVLQVGSMPAWGNVGKEAFRVGVGAGLSIALMLAGVPADYAVGSTIANGAVTAVNTARINGLVDRLRGVYAPH